MYILLHRALRNAGDSLILERARRLIAAYRPDTDVVVAEGWRPLRDQLPATTIRSARAVIVAGGPGYGPGISDRYPLGLDPVADPPLVLLALGSAVVPGTDRQLASHAFDAASMSFLRTVAARTPHLGARDNLTAALLARHGLDRVLMTGDPAWYDLTAPEVPPPRAEIVERIAFTPPAGPIYFAQGVDLARAVARSHPGASGRIVHHRGVQRPFSRLARELGWDEIDITGGEDGFATFDEVDLHVGYRVHAHLYCLSHGRPSWLVAEDSRGTGVLRTLGPLGLTGFSARDDGPVQRLAMQHLPRLANAHRPLTNRLGLPVSQAFAMRNVAAILPDRIATERAAGHPTLDAALARIRATLPVMRQMIEELP